MHDVEHVARAPSQHEVVAPIPVEVPHADFTTLDAGQGEVGVGSRQGARCYRPVEHAGDRSAASTKDEVHLMVTVQVEDRHVDSVSGNKQTLQLVNPHDTNSARYDVVIDGVDGFEGNFGLEVDCN